MPRNPRNGLARGWLFALHLAAAAVPGAAYGQQREPSWEVTPRFEYSDVTINDNEGQWMSSSLTIARHLNEGKSVFASVQQQQRNGTSDSGLQVGGYARIADWNAMALVEANPGASFLPRWAFSAQADHATSSNSRAGIGYRRLQFNDSEIDIWSPYVTFYRGNDELAVSYLVGNNAALDHTIRVVQVRALAIRGKHQISAYLAHGDYIFDALGLPGASGSGWSATLAFARALTNKTTLRLELGKGVESDTFRQQSFAVSLRYSP
ncbi:MAG: YaiO family outer membrane beta-barrel protein [Thermomonas sp.]